MPKVASRPDIAPAIQHLAVPAESLSLWPDNPRQGDVGAISESIKRWGQVRPIIVQKSTMQIIGGNHVYRAAVSLGYPEIAAVILDISDRDAKALAVADNRMSELGTSDEQSLALLLAELARDGNLVGTGYDGDDIDELLRDVSSDAGPDPEAGRALSETPWVKVGEIYQLDRHRVICGDASDPSILDRLLEGVTPGLILVTPPYETDPNNKKPIEEDVIGYLSSRFAGVSEQFWFGADHYRSCLPYEDQDGSWLVWDRRQETADQQFGDAFELIWSKSPHKRDILRHAYTGVTDVEARKRGDLTPRPTALVMDLLERWSKFEAIVLSPFLDSGPTLTAAEKCGRILYGAKASPAHVQSLLERWETYSGQKPTLVQE